MRSRRLHSCGAVPADRVDSATLIASALETEQAKESGGGVVEDLFDLLGSTTPGMDTRDVPGYAIFRAKDLGFTGDYPCKGSLWRGGCQLDGTAEELGAKCSEDPDCVAFVHLPRGFGKRAAPTGFLKVRIAPL